MTPEQIAGRIRPFLLSVCLAATNMSKGGDSKDLGQACRMVEAEVANAIREAYEGAAKLVDGFNENPDWPDWSWTQCAAMIRSRSLQGAVEK